MGNQERRKLMPKEAIIRKLAIEELHDDGWVTWFPYKVRYAKEQDIFGVFDLVAMHPDGKMLFLQLTSYANISARFKKVSKFFETNFMLPNFFHKASFEVWGWHNEKKEFRKKVL